MKTMLRRLTAVAALACSSFAMATGPTSANYAIQASTMNNGVGDMASANYQMSSSLGDSFFAAPESSAAYLLNPGYWNVMVTLLQGCLLDIDGNAAIDPATDGLMLLRAMFGLTGTAVTNGAVGTGATRTNWSQIQPLIHFSKLDVDGNGTTDALTDGLMLLRAMSGLTGTAVTAGAVAPGAPRALWTDVRNYLNTNCGTNFAP